MRFPRLSLLTLGVLLASSAACVAPPILAENGWPLQASREAPARDWRYGAYGHAPGSAPPGEVVPQNPYAQVPYASEQVGVPQGQPYGTQQPQLAQPQHQSQLQPATQPYGAQPGTQYPAGTQAHGQPGSQPGNQPGNQMSAGASPGVATQGGPASGYPNSAGGASAPNTLEPQAPMLGWDGGVVEGRHAGQVEQVDPARGLEPSPGGRMRIIELYSQVLDERDALAKEVEQLRAALERSSSMADSTAASQSDLDRRVRELELENAALMKEKADLVARLVTAQIRRLESDKILVESRIDLLRRTKAQNAVPMKQPMPAREDGR